MLPPPGQARTLAQKMNIPPHQFVTSSHVTVPAQKPGHPLMYELSKQEGCLSYRMPPCLANKALHCPLQLSWAFLTLPIPRNAQSRPTFDILTAI